MKRILTTGIAALFALLAFSTPAVADKCKMKIKVENNHDARIKVKYLKGHPSNTPNNRAAVEQIRNKVILTGQNWTTNKSHNLLRGTIQGQVDFDGGRLYSAAGQRKYVNLIYQLWVPGDNKWVAEQGIYRVTCRHNKTMTLPVPFNVFNN